MVEWMELQLVERWASMKFVSLVGQWVAWLEQTLVGLMVAH